MRYAANMFMAIGLALGLAGCSSDKPAEYGRARPDVDSLDARDRGLQSKDVTTASDQMAEDLLADPKLRQSATQWFIVVDRFEDRTLGRHFQVNYDIFIERLRVNLGKNGGGQVQLVENRDKLAQLRGKELDMPRDQMSQGSGTIPMGRTQPEYALYGKAYDLPNRGTNYYMLEFTLADLRTGTQAWTRQYEVKVAR